MTDDPEAVSVGLYVLVSARLPTPYGYVYRASGNWLGRVRAGMRAGPDALLMPCLAFVVRHPAAGAILIDTGLHPDALADPGADFGFPMRLLFKGIRPARASFDTQLRDAGIAPDEVEHVVMTHLHVDHTSGMRLLSRATFTCARQEWAAAQRRFAAAKGYVARHLPPASRMRLVDVQRDGTSYGSFERSLDLLGDGSIRLISTPGHTPGHLSVLVNVTDRPPTLLVGDAAYTLRSIEDGVLPMITNDDERSRTSLRELRDFAHANPDAILVPTHDPDAWRSLCNPDQPMSAARQV
jgi:glyoxylase-like metal-dependent hydrolase (beta-lactamase superfamily II)